MTATTSTSTTRSRGRPRDPGRDKAILRAARQIIAQCGYTGASMEDIARLAGVGKDTLYRRWSSKEELTISLIDTLARDAVRPMPIDPDPRFNLLMFLKDIVRLNRATDFGQLITGVLGESSRNPELAGSFRAFWARRRAAAAGLVRDIVGNEVSDGEIGSILDHLLGPIYYRILITGEAVDDEFLWDLIVSLPWTADDDITDAA